MEKQVRILGMLHVLLGSFGILAAIIVVFVFESLAQTQGVIEHHNDVGVGAFTIPLLGGLFGGGLAAVVLLLSLPGLIGGIALLMRASWARIYMIVISALDLAHIPFGTVVGIYGLWVLTRPEAPAYFSNRVGQA
jgi:hypothetical protein